MKIETAIPSYYRAGAVFFATLAQAGKEEKRWAYDEAVGGRVILFA
jgi:hypothetical protein